MMNNINYHPSALRVVRFSSPREIRYSIPDRFGCVGFTAYGKLIAGDSIVYVRNPDFDFAGARRNPASVIHNFSR